MPTLLKLPGQFRVKAGFHRHGIIPHPLPPGGVQRLLGVQVEVHIVHDHLHMALGLHVPAHNPKGPHRASVIPQQESGDNGVVAALARLEAVRVSGRKGKVVSPVLEGHAGAGNYYAGTEPHVIGLNIGHHIALFIGATQIDCAALGWNPPGIDLSGLSYFRRPPRAIGG